MQVAVLGAGFQGVCVALELAGRGLTVDLLDRNDDCITQAGYRNDGKVHLGFVYANESDFHTAPLMARGALAFGAALRRWLEQDIAPFVGAQTYHYVVHRDSLLPPEALAAHYAKSLDCVRAQAAAQGLDYLGEDARALYCRPLDDAARAEAYDPRLVRAAFATNERHMKVQALAQALRRRVADDPRIRFHPGTEVRAVRRDDDGFTVDIVRAGGKGAAAPGAGERYAHVVNCLWDGRLAVDQTQGLAPAEKWLFRIKFGMDLHLRVPTPHVPNTTVVLGPFGDLVQMGERHLWLTWYPVCLVGLSSATVPPDWRRERDGAEAERMLRRTKAALAQIVVPLRAIGDDLIERFEATGGIIYAAGETDIDDPKSRLHSRTAVGVTSMFGYHSVDPGKYTLAPLFALETANRVCQAS